MGAGPGAFGPYPHGNKWRVVFRSRDGSGGTSSFTTKEAATRHRDALRITIAAEVQAGRTVSSAIDAYGEYQREKGNRERGMAETRRRLLQFFGDDLPDAIGDLTELRCKSIYTKFKDTGHSVDYRLNVLIEARSLLRWCVRQGWIHTNPLEKVEGLGKRKKGKAQLTIDEARRWERTAFALAAKEPGAVAALCTLMLGMRASEVVNRLVRDLDDDGRLLRIPEAKTKAGIRAMEVPDVLRPHLKRLAKGKASTDHLFGYHWRDWPREWVQAICEKAGVPRVTAHGMRGFTATMGMSHGIGHLVAAALGHESEATTMSNYADRDRVGEAKKKQTLKVLDGGKRGGVSKRVTK